MQRIVKKNRNNLKIRIYLDSNLLNNEEIKVIDKKIVHYLKNVMRIKHDQKIQIFGNLVSYYSSSEDLTSFSPVNVIELGSYPKNNSLLEKDHTSEMDVCPKKCIEWLCIVQKIDTNYIILRKDKCLSSEKKPNFFTHLFLNSQSPIDQSLKERKLTDVHRVRSDILLAIAPIKSQSKFEVIRQATELGVDGIIPIITKNTLASINIDRAKSISIEASEQSDRNFIPRIFEATIFNTFLANRFVVYSPTQPITALFITLIFHHVVMPSTISALKLRQEVEKIVNDIPEIHHITYVLCIGPEGGFTDEEVSNAQKYQNEMHKIFFMTLGSLTLKSDTAAITAISTVKAILGF